ncbi:M48 family metallopeptidase [Pusillimonas sp. NJUB218]|uniref:M48 family metallopeptidase n=1 Tax=Pusillimonas sp. NJUB218 TaxID=2023230 RepID=UPI000F4B8F82|nr:SprT family zinc-dependent metalloprotease [Pusillimonas sp. NJUB218]ROT45936.1 hypothetical protein CHR62_02810 [Pusillimonas sp. NJUB218]
MAKTEQLPLFDAGYALSETPAAFGGTLGPTHDLITPSRHSTPNRSTQIKTEPPPSLPPGAKWREIDTPHQAIGFTLVRSKRRSIGLQITDDGLRVTAPQWVGLGQIDDAVVQKAAWILSKLAHYQNRKQRLAMAQTQWRGGGQIAYLGRQITLALGHPGTAPHQFEGNDLQPAPGNVLHLNLPTHADHTRIRDSVDTWLQARARHWFGLRLDDFHAKFGVMPKQWRLSAAATRWGSCNSAGHIMLNWRLVHFEPAIIDYVIAHELAHLRFMNHSRDFWQEVERLCPPFKSARDFLRGHDPASLPLL